MNGPVPFAIRLANVISTILAYLLVCRSCLSGPGHRLGLGVADSFPVVFQGFCLGLRSIFACFVYYPWKCGMFTDLRLDIRAQICMICGNDQTYRGPENWRSRVVFSQYDSDTPLRFTQSGRRHFPFPLFHFPDFPFLEKRNHEFPYSSFTSSILSCQTSNSI